MKQELVGQRRMLCLLQSFAEGAGGRQPPAAQLQSFLSVSLPRYLREREYAFLPLLQERAAPEDQMDRLAAELRSACADLRARAQKLSGLLAGAAAGDTANRAFVKEARHLCELCRRLMSVEATILIPLARVRFSQSDLVGLAKAMEDAKA